MSYNPWDILSGAKKFIDNGSGSQYDEVKLEAGKPFQFRIVGEPFIFQEHRIEGFKDGKQTVRFVRCRKTHENPTAECKLCDADKALRRRVVCNVYSYADNAIKTLNIGMSAFEVVAQMKAMGLDIASTKFAVTKNGTGLNTSYVTIQCGMDGADLTPFMEQCKNLEELYKPHTDEDIKKICEGIGVSFEDAITPPQLNFPTLEEAKNHVLPFGKHKGKTLGMVWAEDRSPNGYVAWLATKSTRYNDEKACAMVIYQMEGGVPLGVTP